ncbi:NUDIX domain-containing protein [Kitasatospora kifunensis]
MVDEHDQVIGTAPRGEVYRRRLTHRCVMILVRDAERRIFVHRRSPAKLFAPGAHDVFVGGVVGSGESYAEAAVREAEEELGVRGISTEPLFRFLFEETDYSWFCDVHEARWTGPVAPQVEEIDWHGWLTEAEVADRLSRWEFVPDGREAYRRYLARD